MTTVHLIGNAHLDPVWLWRWPAGLVEALATCRTAADLLHEYPDFVFTRSDMWVYQRIEELDPPLFRRIRRLVQQGRWQVVGGWYIQPDCNLPTEESFARHMTAGKTYFRKKFDVDVTVGYNVDSFGHAATLPRFMNKAGYNSYVMMRPMKNEMTLPSSLFRWRCEESEVVTWRIPRTYCELAQDLSKQIEASLEVADPEIGHVMCFYGVGDHGGGPTREQIQWLLDHRNAYPNAELVFSHPRRFFDAVMPFKELLPVVDEELQYHAIGCYSVGLDIKQSMRRAEHGLLMAESTVTRYPELAPKKSATALDDTWKMVLFNQFHDIYAGASIAPACRDALNQLGSAVETADSVIADIHVRQMLRLPPDPLQRIVVFNPADTPYSGYIEHEPWMCKRGFRGRLVDEGGAQVPIQTMRQPLIVVHREKVLWRTELGPQEMKVYRIIPAAEQDSSGAAPADVVAVGKCLRNQFWIAEAGRRCSLLHLRYSDTREALFAHQGLGMEVIHDHSDTWSHGISGFREKKAGAFRKTACVIEEEGPLRAVFRIDAIYHRSRVSLWVRLYRDSSEVEILVHLDWHERLKLVKLVLPFALPIRERRDGIPGGSAVRPQNGREFPFMDWTSVGLSGGSTKIQREIGLVAPDCSSLDGIGNSLRFTLCRSPVYAWHDPAKLRPTDFYRWTDQGEHEFRFILTDGSAPDGVRDRALSLHRPPVCYDWTRGMTPQPVGVDA